MSTESEQLLAAAERSVASASSVASDDLDAAHGGGRLLTNWGRNGKFVPHRLHRLVSRVGAFPPQLPRYFILSHSVRGQLVCDPFCGKGTTLLEAVGSGRRALGCDVAPDAVLMSRAKTNWPSVEEMLDYIGHLPRKTVGAGVAPKAVRVFFHERTLEQILAVRSRLLVDRSGRSAKRRRNAEFATAVLMGILHGHSTLSLSVPCSHVFAMSPGYVERYVRAHGLRRPRRDVIDCLLRRALSVLPGPATTPDASVFESGAEEMLFNRTGAWSGRVDLIVGSPPYLAHQTYAKDAWLRLWLVGIDYHDVARRALETRDVRKYHDWMSRCLAECLRLLKTGGRCFMVCGLGRGSIGGVATGVETAALVGHAARDVVVNGYQLRLERRIMDWGWPKAGSGVVADGRPQTSECLRSGREEVVQFVKARAGVRAGVSSCASVRLASVGGGDGTGRRAVLRRRD